jgi:DNA mismatch endonuclease, patch repair protein
MDNVTTQERSRIMARVKGKNTGPEMLLRRSLFAQGFRYRLHYKDLPGKPDIAFPSRKAAIFVHGCLWHWHGCARSRMPAANADYWNRKIARNQERDKAHFCALLSEGWRVLTVWECSLKNAVLDKTANLAARWLAEGAESAFIEPGSNNRPRLRSARKSKPEGH